MTELSLLIPARNEIFLARTIVDILEHTEGDTEIIAVCDGNWPDPPILDHPKVTLVYHPQSIGQRAAVNEAARLSNAKYIMKVDAHCSFGQGFDVKLITPYEAGELESNVTTIPRMYNLHAFDWRCIRCGERTYQGPTPKVCEKCSGAIFEQVIVWQPRWSRRSDFMRFDHELIFHYWGDYGKRPEAQGDIADVLCGVGACWIMNRDRFWELGGLDEQAGSWGQMGVEIACKSWLSGGRQVVNKRTWFAHLFRTQPGFGFPYPNPGVEQAREYSRHLWLGNNWPKAVHKLDWLIEKFAPAPDWDKEIDNGKDRERSDRNTTGVHSNAGEDDRTATEIIGGSSDRKTAIREAVRESQAEAGKAKKGLVYYTDNRLEENIAAPVRQQLARCCNGHELISVSLVPLDFGRNITMPNKHGILTMFKQILVGLEENRSDIVFLVEHDVLYHPSHFDFIPLRDDTFYYNEHTWKVHADTGQALFYYTKQTSGLCAYRSLLIEHYRSRVERVERDGWTNSIGFEPGTHRTPRGIDDYPAERWMSEYPNIDIRHGANLTPSRWRQDEFRNPKACEGWTEAGSVPGRGVTAGRFGELMDSLR